MTTGAAASIRARLLGKARAENSDFQLFLDRYACERFLYRLGESEVRDCHILKGASLLAVWLPQPYRATRDIDLLAPASHDADSVRETIEAILRVSCCEDGIIFDASTLRVSEIREGQRYGGQRAAFAAFLGTARCNVQVDFGFGDVLVPGPEEVQIPTLIDGMPAPLLRAYPMASSVAEKFEAMVRLGTSNSRMKDFYDVWALSESFAFAGSELQEAVARCFERRGTHRTIEKPETLTSAFYSNPRLQAYWKAYGHHSGLLSPPPAGFADIGNRIQSFLGPVWDSILSGSLLNADWSPKGPWQ